MKVYLPYENVKASISCLTERLLKDQARYCEQILKELKNGNIAGDEVVAAWFGYETAFMQLCNLVVLQASRKQVDIDLAMQHAPSSSYIRPAWLGDKKFHLASMRALIEADPRTYNKLFPEAVVANDNNNKITRS